MYHKGNFPLTRAIDILKKLRLILFMGSMHITSWKLRLACFRKMLYIVTNDGTLADWERRFSKRSDTHSRTPSSHGSSPDISFNQCVSIPALRVTYMLKYMHKKAMIKNALFVRHYLMFIAITEPFYENCRSHKNMVCFRWHMFESFPPAPMICSQVSAADANISLGSLSASAAQ